MYREHDLGAREYQSWFQLCNLVVATLPQHPDFKGMAAKQERDYQRLRQAVRQHAMPRCEELKPQVRSGDQVIRWS